MDHRCVPSPKTRPRVGPCVCACMWVVAHTIFRGNVRALSVGVDRGWLGSQVFFMATAFNANIGAWNIASVSNFSQVCAAFGRRRAPLRMLSAGLR